MLITDGKVCLLDLSRRSNSGILDSRLDRSVNDNPGDGAEPLADFVAQIAHEVRNPLAGIATTIDILGDMYDEKGKNYCALLKKEVGRVSNMLKNLLNLCTPSGKHKSACNFKKTLWMCIEFYELLARNSDVTITLEMDQTEVMVPMSETKLMSVLQNVIINALESMEGGGYLTLRCTMDQEDSLQLALRDTGKGIDKKNQESVFKPFWSDRKGGTGLGLAVTRRFISEAGGTINLRSFPGQGTEVCITLPIVSETETEAESKQESKK
jgi:two-component system, sporulation sensor kinase D